MTPEQWRQVEQLCEAALKLPSEERPAFLQQSCGNDATLRQQVEALLEGYERSNFLEQPAMEVAARAMATSEEGFLVGRQIGHYRILSTLGAGGMGEVYRAHDDQLQRDVAIKVLSESAFSDIPARARLLREARSAAALNHSNVCTIYEVGEAEGLGYIAMELIEGQPLGQLIPAGGLGNSDVVRYGLQIADATGHAHEKGIIHRDLKTSNILVAKQRQVKVLDFGLAKRVTKDQLSAAPTAMSVTLSTVTGGLIGTLPYMSPEQLRGQPADARSDVWAIGVILYELAAGLRPFQGQTTFDLSASILTRTPPPLPGKVPPALDAVIQRCLQKEPGDRYADGADVRTALEAIPVTSTTGMPPGATAPKRRPHLYVALGVAALIVLGFALARMNTPADTPTTPATIRRFTSYNGWEFSPSWSPDRSRIAYTHIVGSSADIAVMSPGGDPQILTKDSPADEFNPSFSPKGSRIAYVSDRGSGTNIYSIPASGGAERKEAETHIPFLQRMGAWAGSLGSNPWSPDENHIVFSKLRPGGDVALFVVTLDTGAERQLTSPPAGAEDGSGIWSPDSQTIVFTRTHNGFTRLWAIPAAGGKESVVLEDGFLDMMPAWTPDGTGIVFSSVRSGAVNLWETKLGARTPPRQLTFGTGQDFTPAVAQDGSIAYGQFDHEIDIYRVNLEARNLEEEQGEKLTTYTGENFGPRIASDGKVLYYSNRDNNYDVWAIDKAGMHRNLTHHEAADRLADWSPDSKEVVFMSDRDGSVRLWVHDVETEKVRLLTPRDQSLMQASHTAEAEGGPRWSPDGKSIAYIAPAEGGSAIWVVGRDGSNPHATKIRGATSFAWYKDSQRLIYTRQEPSGSGQQELVATNLETGVEQTLRTGAIAEIAVSADGGKLSFTNSVSHFTMDLFVMNLTGPGSNGLPRAGREVRQVTFGKGVWHAHAGGFSADGKTLVYSRDRDFGDIHVIEKSPKE
jgi:serine/threonine protein kinase